MGNPKYIQPVLSLPSIQILLINHSALSILESLAAPVICKVTFIQNDIEGRREWPRSMGATKVSPSRSGNKSTLTNQNRKWAQLAVSTCALRSEKASDPLQASKWYNQVNITANA